MKKLLKLATRITFLIFSLSVFSQNIDFSDIESITSKKTEAKIEVKGTPYVNEDFELVKVSISDSIIYNGRFNAYSGNMEIKISDKIMILDLSKDIDVLFINNKKHYKTCSFTQKDSSPFRGFLVSLSNNDNIELLKQEKISFIDKKPAKSSYDEEQPAKFLKEPDSYFYKVEDKINYLPTKKKDFLKLFPDYETELKNYIKTEKLNIKNEDDLIKIIEFLSTIIE